MPSLIGQKQLSHLRKLPFCYICGKVFHQVDIPNRDHVPPQSCISNIDKVQSPLILPTHQICNSAYKVADERLGQFLSVLHGKIPKPEHNLLKFTHFYDELDQGAYFQVLQSVDVYGAVARWLMALHAALYQQPLHPNFKYAIELPLDVGYLKEGKPTADTGRPNQRTMCEERISCNRAIKTVDKIAAWNGKLQYECTWFKGPTSAICVFWLSFYQWSRLSRISKKQEKECVGFYIIPIDELPAQATIASELLAYTYKFRFPFEM
jgi:hypothetical protein